MCLSDLHPHPLQAKYFDAPANDEVLKESLQEGQDVPIEVLPANNAAGLEANTIVAGHRRAQLLKELGKTHALVVVRDDLLQATAEDVEAIFLGSNFHRRQLHPVDEALIAKRLLVLKHQREGNLPPSFAHIVNCVAEVMPHKDIKTWRRYAHLLNAPEEVIKAVRDGRLNLVHGARVHSLPIKIQTKIAAQIAKAATRDVNALVKKHFKASRRKHNDLAIFLATTEKITPKLLELDQTHAYLFYSEAERLKKAQQLLNHLVSLVPSSPPPAPWQQFMESAEESELAGTVQS